jgi:hypothetical protein
MLALLVAGLWLLAADHAQAARYVRVTVKQDGKEILRTGTGDNGRVPPEVVWTYLKDVRFRQRYAQNDFQIVPDKDNPDQVTIVGKLEVIVRYSGKANLQQLLLVRVKKPREGVEWVIHSDDYERLLKLRKPR